MSMGVYIEGIEIPTEEQSVITINIYSDGVVTCYDDDVERKAVPVPPHGDLIDRDALEYMEMETCDTEDSFRIIERVAGRNRIRKIVRDAPTIIPASEEGE